ncbi:type 4a pilus biogenesis protein PilO [uncultured Rubinisphaera sp.]|uniref:type 4a pilus biogenesis protein PilO n=1 Tax=uncultured Rubinisphaera sp. TaxID=1678686 RepID=UPI0030DC58F0|tara:strand:- start:1114 stop:1704 length:591 start_codon:yes stop_codon:yes gene_type:complete
MNSLSNKLSITQFTLLIHSAGGLTILVVLIVAWFCFIHPMQQKLSRNQSHVEIFNQLGEQRTQVEQLNHELTSQLQLATSDVETITRKISDKLVIDQFLQKTGNLAEKHQVHIQEFRPGNFATHGEYQALTVSMSLSGSFAGICKFFKELEDLDRMNRVKSAQISPQGAAGENCSVSMVLELYTLTPSAIAVHIRE